MAGLWGRSGDMPYRKQRDHQGEAGKTETFQEDAGDPLKSSSCSATGPLGLGQSARVGRERWPGPAPPVLVVVWPKVPLDFCRFCVLLRELIS